MDLPNLTTITDASLLRAALELELAELSSFVSHARAQGMEKGSGYWARGLDEVSGRVLSLRASLNGWTLVAGADQPSLDRVAQAPNNRVI